MVFICIKNPFQIEKQFHVPCYEVQADLATKALPRESLLGWRQKTLLTSIALVSSAGKGTECHRFRTRRSCWCASSTVHPQTRDQRLFLDGALHKHGPVWLILAGPEALQAAAFA